MTDSPGTPRPRRSPREIRTATFTQRRRGFDPDEVRDFLEGVADQIQFAADERSRLLAEVERLRSARVSDSVGGGAGGGSGAGSGAGGGGAGGEVNSQAVALLSQAQLVADRLVAEHEQHSRHVLSNARARQRELLEHTHESQLGSPLERNTRGYAVPVPQIEYVRTYTKIAQGQLRSVLEALSEQVEKLGDLPQLNDGREQPQAWDR